MQKFFTLFIIASTILSCERFDIPVTGHFSHYNDKINRHVASLEVQDPKQIYLSCVIRQKDSPESCFYQKTKEKNLNVDFIKVEGEVKVIANHILNQLSSRIQEMAKKRSNFCEHNSTISIQKCLYQLLEREVVNLTNIYQEEHPDLNGLEFLYLRERIKEVYSKILLTKEVKLSEAENLNINKIIKKNYDKFEKILLSDRSWIQKEKFLTDAYNYCKNFIKNEIKEDLPEKSYHILSQNEAIDENCLTILSKNDVLKEINFYTNKEIEKVTTIITEKIQKETTDLLLTCKEKNTPCLREQYKKAYLSVIKSWEKNLDNGSFFKENKDLVLNKIRKSPRIQTRDIASVKEEATP